MFKKEEFVHIIFAVFILAFVVSFPKVISGDFTQNFLLTAILFLAVIILLNVTAKKIAANNYEAVLETKIWSWQRYGIARENKLLKPIPAGIIFPFLASIISYGTFFLFAVLESDIQGTTARASKRHGIYRYTEMTDSHIGIITSMGVIANLLLAIFAYFASIPELGKWSVYYAIYSLVPFGNLDGTKIFFGNKVWWFILAIISLIGLSYVLFLP